MATDAADPREAAKAQERQIEDNVFLGGDDFPPMGGTSDTDADPTHAETDQELAPDIGDDPEAEDAPTLIEWPEDIQVPERLKGKSAADIAKEFASLQTEFGRQSTELGETRAAIRDLVQEQLIQSRAQQAEPKPTKEISYEDFESDPITAVKTVVQSALQEALEPVQKQSEQAQVSAQIAELNAEYPNFQKTVQTQEFADWVKASPYRQRVYQQAQGWDFDAARELLSGFNELPKDDPVEEQSRQVRQRATVKGGGGGRTPVKGKTFRYTAAEMARMYIDNREKYNEIYPEFEKAWSEGRVK